MSRGIVDDHYTDAFGDRVQIAPEVRRAVLDAMRLDADEAPEDDLVAVVRPGGALPVRGEVLLEDGTALGDLSALPPDVPAGYHRLRGDDARERLLLTGPGRCPLPRDLRAWGWAVQLASTRSERSWGIGDLDDLRRLAVWTGERGGGFVAVSPLGAPNPGPRPEPSPYYPSTRRFGSPLHVAIESIAGADGLGDLAERARALNAERRVDRIRVAALKTEAFERLWRAEPAERDRFEAWRAERGAPLERWATFAALTERLGPGWQSWPEAYRRPDAPEVAAYAADATDRVAFHAWVQWCFDVQLAGASAPLRRIADMPVGVDPGGFDAWDWQEQLAIGASVGAPPDRFNAAGQNWGLPPFIPHRLRQAGYRPFIETIRAQLRHAGGLRIDHVLGLFRQWWVPAGDGPARGAYVRYRTDELLEIVAIESHRAGAIVIGEDLGTVPPGVRAELRRRDLLSTRLAYFEKKPPARWVRNAFAAVTTHDLPTIAGVWSGSDLADQAAAGVRPDPKALALLRRRLLMAAGLAGADPLPTLDEVVGAVHARIAAAPPMLVAATLEDALRVEERPNLPGTTRERRDNWSLALPLPLEELMVDPGVGRLVEGLRRPT